jgi:hypothetical protein
VQAQWAPQLKIKTKPQWLAGGTCWTHRPDNANALRTLMVGPLSPDAFHASRLSFFIPRLFGLVMMSRHTRLYSPYGARLSPDRQACLRHASRSQARPPQSPSSYHDRQIVRSPAYSAGLCAHDFSVCVPHPGLSLCAIPAPSLSAQGMTTAIRSYVFASLAIRALIAYMILLLA